MALSFGILLATPAEAIAPRPHKNFIKRDPISAKNHAQKLMSAYNWSNKEWQCLDKLWTAESNWRPNAKNKELVKVVDNGLIKYVHAGGIPQILGLDPKISVEDQILAGMTYITKRYGNPCVAWEFHLKNNWY